MKNIVELRNELTSVFESLKAGDVTPKVATEMNNAAGKIISSLKIQLEYANLRKEKPEVEFLKAE